MNKVVHSRDGAKGVHGWRWAEASLFQSQKLSVLFSVEGERKYSEEGKDRKEPKKRFSFQKLTAVHIGTDS